MILRLFAIPFILICVSVMSFSEKEKEQTHLTLIQEKSKTADDVVNEMLERLGGKEKWSQLKSIYIDAIHYEERLEKPYRSEIWRNLEGPQIRIVQTTDNFTSYRILNDKKGWSKREGQEWKPISQASLEWLLNWDAHLIYRAINRLATEDNLQVELKEEDTLVLSEKGQFYALIELDEKGFPYRFGVPSVEGDTTFTLYPDWKETQGLHHPTVSTSEDGAFRFETQKWKWSTSEMEDSFFSVQ